MNFGKTDFILLLTMTLAVVSMSFMFPALGLTTEDPAQENEIPEFNISTERFNLVGEFPQAPGTPTQGNLWLYAEDPAAASENRVWIDGDTSDGVEMFLSEESSANSTGEIRINTWDAGSVVSNQTATFSSENDTFTLVSSEGFGFRYEVSEIRDSPRYYEVDYTITQRPRDTGGFISSLLGSAGDTAKTLVWFGTIFIWGSTFIVELGLNALGLVFDSLSFFITLLAWLVSTYTGVISAATGFASVFVAIPGIILSMVLAKMVFIGITLLPTT